ncbi:uncharacterized protein LOC112047240 [Bicyclus anynana]|uniref:Uncharacterized protein LOC112047240 n=1 Tax=Bicyclus anynana TaxID=110368 RepID=A0A6J1NAJ3_BICAN|nr:uncharacterized protein LOC112047240 [Bicyclus anynana]
MCDCSAELESKSSRPIPSLQSEASSLSACEWMGWPSRSSASSQGGEGRPKTWMSITVLGLGGTTLTLFALFYKFKDKIKTLIWGSPSDPCNGLGRKTKQVREKNKLCVC